MVVIHTMTPSVSMALPPVATVGGLDAELPCLGHGFAHADEGVPVAMQPNLPARCDLSLEILTAVEYSVVRTGPDRSQLFQTTCR